MSRHGRFRSAAARIGGDRKDARLHHATMEQSDGRSRPGFRRRDSARESEFVNLIAHFPSRGKSRPLFLSARITTQRLSTRFASSARMTAARAPALLIEMARVLAQHPDRWPRKRAGIFRRRGSLRKLHRHGWTLRQPLFCGAPAATKK